MMDKKIKNQYTPCVIAIGGLDPSGGAGILIDCAAIRAVGVHPAAVLAVSTVQDGISFKSAKVQDPAQVVSTVSTLISRFHVGAVKIGAMGNAAMVQAIARLVDEDDFPPLVVDPVILSTTKGVLLDDVGVKVMREKLLPRTTLITPNLVEASILTGQPVSDLESMTSAGRKLIEMGAGQALIKGGHLDETYVADVFIDSQKREEIFRSQRHPVGEVRGTGCALASLIAGNLAKGAILPKAIEDARNHLNKAIKNAIKVASGPSMLMFEQ